MAHGGSFFGVVRGASGYLQRLNGIVILTSADRDLRTGAVFISNHNTGSLEPREASNFLENGRVVIRRNFDNVAETKAAGLDGGDGRLRRHAQLGRRTAWFAQHHGFPARPRMPV